MATKEKNNSTADRELRIERLLNAPRELVWEVWTNPDHIKNWWGPTGFTNTIAVMEVRPGGVWEFVMHGPDGTDYKNKSIFKEIVKPERIVFDHVSGPKFTTTVNFIAEGKKTRLTWHMLFETKEQFEQTVKIFKADEGLKQNIVKLDAYLQNDSFSHFGKTEPAGTRELTLTRMIDAPQALVYQAFTDPAMMTQWWGPHGFTNTECAIDAQPKGKWKINMSSPEFPNHWCNGSFVETKPNEKIVFISRGFLDANDRAGIESRNTVTLENVDGKTRLTLHITLMHLDEQLQLAWEGSAEGWSQSLEKLNATVYGIATRQLIFERLLNAPVATVWKALTDGNEMKKWYFDLPGFKAEVGYRFQFTGGPAPDRQYLHVCEVTEVIPQQKLTYSWRYDGYEGNSFVTFQLFAEGSKTRLVLSHKGLETFPASNADFGAHNFVKGWTHILHTSLRKYVEQ
jgi:uncharacterized protein YndB with AHSA1/START domain